MPRRGENIYKRKDGRWEGRYKKYEDSFGKVHYGYVYAHNYNEVKEKLYNAKSNQGCINFKPEKSATVIEICELWLDEVKLQNKYSTYVKYYNSMIGMSLTFAEDPTTENITATLSGNGSEVSITPEALGGNEYKFMWNQFLPSSEYTFKVMYGSDEYIYTFTPVPSSDISIKEFGLFNSSSVEIKNANDLIAGENYTASVKIYNPTGDESKTAYLIYAIYSDNGETLEAVNFADSALSGSVDGNALTRTFTMPEGLNNPIVKVFLWKNIEFAVPYADNLVIGRN